MRNLQCRVVPGLAQLSSKIHVDSYSPKGSEHVQITTQNRLLVDLLHFPHGIATTLFFLLDGVSGVFIIRTCKCDVFSLCVGQSGLLDLYLERLFMSFL